ncbi:MAG: hypothetical protein R3F20_13415 [Planctomycetota bacterium]
MRRAVDVILLPDETTRRYAERVSAQRTAPDDAQRLGPGRGIAHLSLAMGVLEDGDRLAVEASLERLVLESPAPELVILGPVPREGAGASGSLWLALEVTPGLRALHDAARAAIRAPTGPPPRPDDLHPSAREPLASTLDYIARFEVDAAGAAFSPHVTLGRGTPTADRPPARMRAVGLALAWLGERCSCREILWRRDW